MSVIYSFMDDSVYGADDINNVFSKLTTEGVSLFSYTNGDNPLVSLNEAVKGFLEPGVEMYNPDACKVGYDSANGKFTIGVGNAFMVDGSTITIDSEPYDITAMVTELRKTQSGDIWVCFYRNIPMNRIDILVEADDTKFNSEYGVKLAKISSSNTIADMREFAKTKILPCSANVIQEESMEGIYMEYKDGKDKRKRVVFKNIFPGATKVLMHGILHDIQRVDATGGDALSYKLAINGSQSSGEYVAFNFSDEGLEVWMYVTYNYTTTARWNLVIF